MTCLRAMHRQMVAPDMMIPRIVPNETFSCILLPDTGMVLPFPICIGDNVQDIVHKNNGHDIVQ